MRSWPPFACLVRSIAIRKGDENADLVFEGLSLDAEDHEARAHEPRSAGDEESPCPVQHQAPLLLRLLGGYEPHVGPLHCLTDCLGIGGIVLVALDVRLNVGPWHELHFVPLAVSSRAQW
jgi:hypothetical protein